MENQNETTGQDLSQLKSMFSEYQKKQTQSSSKASRENILAKYFVPRNTKETFRILPPKPGRKHIGEAFFHVLTTNASGGKKKHGTVIYCPAHNDRKVPKLDTNGDEMFDSVTGNPILVPAPCPACAEYKRLIKTQDPSLKGIKKENMTPQQQEVRAKNNDIYKKAIKFEAKKFYIVRGIDKGQEKDGVKFWRFKHNYKNQGTLDKLLPILENYMTKQQADFSDPVNGTDLTIIMTDTEWNNHVYKQISAITADGKSPLHGDKVISDSWLNDDITWRDVFKPKQAPGMSPFEYLKSVVDEVTPYWDDTDSNNKRWVFPGHPDLEIAANTRTRTFDTDGDKNFEQASDLEDTTPKVTIGNVTAKDVGKYNDTATDVGAEALGEKPKVETPKVETLAPVVSMGSDEAPEDTADDGNYDDLPF